MPYIPYPYASSSYPSLDTRRYTDLHISSTIRPTQFLMPPDRENHAIPYLAHCSQRGSDISYTAHYSPSGFLDHFDPLSHDSSYYSVDSSGRGGHVQLANQQVFTISSHAFRDTSCVSTMYGASISPVEDQIGLEIPRPVVQSRPVPCQQMPELLSESQFYPADRYVDNRLIKSFLNMRYTCYSQLAGAMSSLSVSTFSEHTSDTLGHNSASHQEQEKKHRCPHCDWAFARKHNLKTHMQVHNPHREKPYACSEPGCESKFSRRHDCERHKRVHNRKATTSSQS